jgi:hypothetical protein
MFTKHSCRLGSADVRNAMPRPRPAPPTGGRMPVCNSTSKNILTLICRHRRQIFPQNFSILARKISDYYFWIFRYVITVSMSVACF